MRRTFRSCIPLVLFALGGLTVAGCGGGGAKPKGQLLLNGQPYKLGEGESVSLAFSPTEPGKGSGQATVAKDGSFTVEQGLEPGSYQVVLLCMVSTGNGPPADKFGGAFSGSSSPLKVDIGSESSPFFEIDLAKKTVTKK